MWFTSCMIVGLDRLSRSVSGCGFKPIESLRVYRVPFFLRGRGPVCLAGAREFHRVVPRPVQVASTPRLGGKRRTGLPMTEGPVREDSPYVAPHVGRPLSRGKSLFPYFSPQFRYCFPPIILCIYCKDIAHIVVHIAVTLTYSEHSEHWTIR